MKKTQLDLYNSAHAAAAATLDMNTTFEVESAALEIFRAEKQDPKHWDMWRGFFTDRRNYMIALRTHELGEEV